MRLKLPSSLHYPITVTELLKRPSDNVKRSTPLFLYFYKTKVTEFDRSGEEHEVEKTFPSQFESSVDGTLREWFLAKGTVISRPGYVAYIPQLDVLDSLITFALDTRSLKSRNHARTVFSLAVCVPIVART